MYDDDAWELCTWKDVERWVLANRREWQSSICNIRVYGDAMYVVYRKGQEIPKKCLQNLFMDAYDSAKEKILLSMDDELNVVWESEEEVGEQGELPRLPLFRSVLYEDEQDAPLKPEGKLDDPLVIAFHSYKGGVGRTVSLLAFLEAWSYVNGEDKFLVVDADIEAPGISFLWNENTDSCPQMSYLDFLQLLQDHSLEGGLLDIIADKVKDMTIAFDVKKRRVSHFFLPTYRYQKQLMDLYARPEDIVRDSRKRYAIGDALSALGKRLGVKIVLVDLRAGLSEFSAPILFDPRIRKYIVTSTSMQSIEGTKILLQQIMKVLSQGYREYIPEILLNMIPRALRSGTGKNVLKAIVSDLHQTIQSYGSGTDDNLIASEYVRTMDFSENLMHLGVLTQIFESFKGTTYSHIMHNLVRSDYFAFEMGELPDRDEILHSLRDSVTGWGNDKRQFVVPEAVGRIFSRYGRMPCYIIYGTRGTGKTYLFQEMLISKSWGEFLSKNKESGRTSWGMEEVFVPVLASEEECEKLHLSKYVEICRTNLRMFREFAEGKHTSEEWMHDFWKEVLIPKNEPVIYVIDDLPCGTAQEAFVGLERFIRDYYPGRNPITHRFGVIFFTANSRWETIQSYRPLYRQIVMLRWTETDTLRLLYRLMPEQLIRKEISDAHENLDGIEPSKDSIENLLAYLWGGKLGKGRGRPNTTDWVLKMLKDGKDRIRPLDVIRFLQYALDIHPSAKDDEYHDRCLKPSQIFEAFKKLSIERKEEACAMSEKIGEIISILSKLPKDPKSKQPLDVDLNLDEEQVLLMKKHGLFVDDSRSTDLSEFLRVALQYS